MKIAAHFISDLDGQIELLCASMERVREAHRDDMSEKQLGVWEGQMRALAQTIAELRAMRMAWAKGEPAFHRTEQMIGGAS